MKNSYQDNQFFTSVDIFALSDDLRYGYKVFRELIIQHKKMVQPLNEVQEEYENNEKEQFNVTFKTSKFQKSPIYFFCVLYLCLNNTFHFQTFF